MAELDKPSPSQERDTTELPATTIWSNVRKALKAAVKQQEYRKWIADLEFVAEVDGEILVSARDEMQESRVQVDYLRLINSAWRATDPRARLVRVQSRTTIRADILSSAPPRLSPDALRAAAEVKQQASVQRVLREQTFDTLVVGDANRMAANLMRMTAEGAMPPAGIVMLYGPHGVGKTHHLKSLAHALTASGKGNDVIYITAQEFLTAYISGSKARDTSELRARVRGAKYVLFDDLHVICGKPGTEREFWETLREITMPDEDGQSGYVFIAAEAPPSQISGLSPRIRSDLSGGVLVELTKPDARMIREIVERKIELLQQGSKEFELSPEMIDRIVFAIDDGPRVLTGVLTSLYSECLYTQSPVTMAMVDAAIARHIGQPIKPTIEEIKRAVSDVTGVSRAMIEADSRQRAHALARHLVMYLSRDLTDKSLPQIGRALGDRHHTSVMHGRQKIAHILDSEAGAAAQRTEIRELIEKVMLTLRDIVSNRTRPAA